MEYGLINGSGPVLGDTHTPRSNWLTHNLITAVILICNVGHHFSTHNNCQSLNQMSIAPFTKLQ